MTIYYLLVGIAVVLVVLVLNMVIVTVKNVKKNGDSKNIKKIDDDIKWKHRMDFKDINFDNNGKLQGFDSSFDEDVMTSGVVIPLKKKNEPSAIQSVLSNEVKASPIREENKTENNNLDTNKVTENVSAVGENISDDKKIELVLSQHDVESVTQYMPHDEMVLDVSPKIKVTLNYNDGKSNKVMKMASDILNVGREPGNDLILWHNSYLSRWHAVFCIREDRLFLKDLNSKNGTYYEGKRITDEIEIVEDCDVKFGSTVVHIKIER